MEIKDTTLLPAPTVLEPLSDTYVSTWSKRTERFLQHKDHSYGQGCFYDHREWPHDHLEWQFRSYHYVLPCGRVRIISTIIDTERFIWSFQILLEIPHLLWMQLPFRLALWSSLCHWYRFYAYLCRQNCLYRKLDVKTNLRSNIISDYWTHPTNHNPLSNTLGLESGWNHSSSMGFYHKYSWVLITIFSGHAIEFGDILFL